MKSASALQGVPLGYGDSVALALVLDDWVLLPGVGGVGAGSPFCPCFTSESSSLGSGLGMTPTNLLAS